MEKSNQPPPQGQPPSYALPPQQQGYPPPPPPPQQQGYPPPPQAPSYGYDNNIPSYGQQPPPPPNNGYYAGESQEKAIRPSSGWKDIWAAILWLLNFGAFIGVSVLALRTYSGNQGHTAGGIPSSTQYSGVVFDTDAMRVFGYAAIVGFGLSFLYLMLINA